MGGDKNEDLWRILFAGIFVSGILAIFDITSIAVEKGFSLSQPKWLLLIGGIFFLTLGSTVLFSLTWSRHFSKIEASLDAFLRLSAKVRWGLLPLLIAIIGALTAFELTPFTSDLFDNRLWIKIFLFLIFSLIGALFLQAIFPSLVLRESLTILALTQLLVYQLTITSLYITDYPFAIGWTRDSRYYYASLFFAQKLYAQNIPLPVLHPTLHFIFSAPFLFDKLPLWVHRAWSVFLTLGLSGAIVLVLQRRYISRMWQKTSESDLRNFWLYGVWAFLFVLVGSVYAHLLIPALLVFAFVSPERKKRSWGVVILASLWAGLSRINWFPVPAMLAVLIYFLEVPRNEKSVFEYLKLPVLWFGVGTASAFLSQAAYIQLSGNGVRDEFYTSLSSDLLWYRLLPNETYPPGILWGAIFLSLPLVLFSAWFFYGQRGHWKPIRVWGIFAIIFTLFVGGLIVSTKIGGGADLHNMDAYFISVLLVTGIVFARGFVPDTVTEHLPGEMPLPLKMLGIFVLAWFIFHGRGSFGYDHETTDAALADLQARVTEVAERGEKVLFISQRHLLATGLIKEVPLVSEYEKDILMEMAMSRNRPYLDQFYIALRQQDFGMIVVDPQSELLVGEDRSFGVENNRWVLKITRPLICFYEPVALYEDVGVELYVPRTGATECE